MTYRGVVRWIAGAASLCGAIVGPVSAAGASSGSIKAAIVSYGPKIDVAEGHVLTAIGEYKESKNPTAVQAAISSSVGVLGSLKSDVAHQSARAPRVKKARAKVEGGLQAVIAGYQDLSTAYGEAAASPEAAGTEATNAVIAVKKGQTELREGVKLLG